MTTLYERLLAAGVPVETATDDGIVTFLRTLNDAERQAYFNIMEPPSDAELAIRNREAQAKTNALAVTLWAKCTEADALAWGTTNISAPLANERENLQDTLTLASTRVVILAILDIMGTMWVMLWELARMVIALRDKTWPDLPDS